MPSSLMICIALLTVFLSCLNALAATPVKDIPKTIDVKMGAKTLKFEHTEHIKALDNICIYCHLTEKGKIDGGFGKDTARILCIPCHDKDLTFKSECKECHNSLNANKAK